LNPYESGKILVQGEGFYEDITFEGLPKDLEDELDLEHNVIGVEKRVGFYVRNNSNNQVKFSFNTGV